MKSKSTIKVNKANKLMVISVERILSYGGVKYYVGKYVRTIKE